MTFTAANEAWERLQEARRSEAEEAREAEIDRREAELDAELAERWFNGVSPWDSLDIPDAPF